MPRQLYIVAYDVSDPRRLRRALATCRAFATGGQKSVHECFLSPAEKSALAAELARIVDRRTDSAVLLRLDPRPRVRCLGLAQPPRDEPFFYFG